jgi:hypothetical protein
MHARTTMIDSKFKQIHNVRNEKTSSMVLASNMPKHLEIITRQLYVCIKQLLLLSTQINVANCSPLFSQAPQA